MKNILIILLCTMSLYSFAEVFQVGSTKDYTTPNALYLAALVQDGDTILIDAENYSGQATLAVWFANDLLIRGIGGKPHLEANGASIWDKGIWVVAGNNNIIENIEFSGAAVDDLNGAGIRLDGNGMTVRNCYFHDNENGILTTNTYAGEILIEYTEFENNGAGDGQSHNLYIGHCDKLTFQYNYSHHAIIGHNLKSRAEENYILYNRIMDEETGFASRLIDLPSGGLSIIMGNLLMQGENATNNNLIGYGLEGLINSATHEVYIINNTFVNKRAASCLFLSVQDGTSSTNIYNNIFAGTGVLINDPPLSMDGNYIIEDISLLAFRDEANYDYNLTSISPVIDLGIDLNSINNYPLTPIANYEHPLSFSNRTTNNGTIDIGAYEYEQMVSTHNSEANKISLHPNPTNGLLVIDAYSTHATQLDVYDAHGRLVLSSPMNNHIDISHFSDGIYTIKIFTKEGNYHIHQILKI